MARRVNLKDKTHDPLILELPWGDYEVRRPTRSVTNTVFELQSRVDELSEDQSPDDACDTFLTLLDACLKGDGFREGAQSAWESDDIGLVEIFAIVRIVMDEVLEGNAEGEG